MSYDMIKELRKLNEDKYNFISESLKKLTNEEVYIGTKYDINSKISERMQKIDDYIMISKVPICEEGEEEFYNQAKENYDRAMLCPKILKQNPNQISEMCPCGGSFCKSTRQRHCNTKMHKKYFNII